MNRSWTKVFGILQKRERLIIGLMSGTSLDGLDIALCGISGSGVHTKVRLLNFKTTAYEEQFKADVKAIFSRRDADLQLVCLMNERIGILHAQLVLDALGSWGLSAEDVDVIASHGQTIFHAPQSLHGLPGYPNGTLQIGDGDHIAMHTGIITIADFRQKHLAAGAEGAPLAVYGDYLLFSKAGEDRVMLNIGGIANFTYLPANQDASKVFSTDVGPGNTLMDQYVQRHYPGRYFDEGGRLAMSGVVNEDLLNSLFDTDFLRAGFPKTTGPELFNLSYLEDAQNSSGTLFLNPEDVMATLCAFTGNVIVAALKHCFGDKGRPSVYMSGGGMHNPVLVDFLRKGLPDARFFTTNELEVHPDAKEAILFAVLANETLVGNETDYGNRPGIPSVGMGKICLPL